MILLPRYSKLLLLYLLLLLLLASCGINKHIPQGSYLLNMNEIEVNDTINKNKLRIKNGEFTNLVIQDPNSKFFFLGKIGLRVYCLSNPKSNSWINRTLRTIGQEPVIYDPSLSLQTSEKMQQYLMNKGAFTSGVEVLPAYKGKKVDIKYKIQPSKRYIIQDVSYIADEDDTIQKILNIWKSSALIKKNSYYDYTNLSKDRDRVASLLENRGFYGFLKEDIIYEADTNFNNDSLSLILKVINNNSSDSVGKSGHKQYTIRDVYIIPQSNLYPVIDSVKFDTTIVTLFRKKDSIYHSYKFLHKGEMPINPITIARNLFIDPNSLYRTNTQDRTYNSVSGLNNFKYLNISYIEVDSTSNTKNPQLDAYIRLIENEKQSFSTSFDFTTSSLSSENSDATNWGLEWNFNYQNKNLFGNAEILNAKYRMAVQIPQNITSTESDRFLSYFSSFETGINLSLDIPKFIVPFRTGLFPRTLQPKTNLNAGYNYQYKPDYERTIPSIGFGYKWRTSRRTEHAIFPLEFNAVKVYIKSEDFQEYVNNLTDLGLQYQYTDHLIFDAHYTLSTTSQQIGVAKDFTAFSIGLESAGNVFYAIDRLSNADKNDDGLYQKIGTPYSQYVRVDFDLKRYFYLSRKAVFVLRTYIGTGFTYGNSYSMPYEKSFYGGGPNGVRAWKLRNLGPGSFQNTSNTIFDRIGDFSFCLNIEQRFPLVSLFEGAVFVDAGNIWLQRKSDEFPGGDFAFNRFYKEFGIAGGFGIRADLQIFSIRLDMGIPFRDPGREDGERWRLDKLQFRDITFNFGIGYPF